jgi:hypothetical protein
MRSAYIALMPKVHWINHRSQVLPPSTGSAEPTVGSIKHALYELSHTTSGSAPRENGAVLREAYELLRTLALRDGIDPDDAVQARRATAQAQRRRMVLASGTASDQTLS